IWLFSEDGMKRPVLAKPFPRQAHVPPELTQCVGICRNIDRKRRRESRQHRLTGAACVSFDPASQLRQTAETLVEGSETWCLAVIVHDLIALGRPATKGAIAQMTSAFTGCQPDARRSLLNRTKRTLWPPCKQHDIVAGPRDCRARAQVCAAIA